MARRIKHNRPSLPVQLLSLLTMFVLIGLLYNVSVPLFEPPDEVWHFAFAAHLASGLGLPHFSGEHKPVYLREAGQPPLYYAITGLAIAPFDRGDFPGFVRFNASHPTITPGATSDRPNVFIHTHYEDWPYGGAALAVHVARLVSLVFGLLTVLGVYAIVRLVAPTHTTLAVVTTAIAAFTPQFVLLSNAVNNDSLMAATATWTVWASMKFHTSDPGQPRGLEVSRPARQLVWPVVLGLALGLALLSKLSAIVLIPFVGLVLLITWLRHPTWPTPSREASSPTHYVPRQAWDGVPRQAPHSLRSGTTRDGILRPTTSAPLPPVGDYAGWYFTHYVLPFAIAFLVAGWWYVRNTALYGDPLAWQVWLSDIGVREPTPAVWQLVPEIPALFRTYWIEFTYGKPVPWLWLMLTALSLIAIAGCLCIAAKKISDFGFRISDFRHFAKLHPSTVNLLLALIWLGLIAAGVIRYMQTTPAAQGRLLFPAIAVTSLLLAAGLSAWPPTTNWLAFGLAGGLLILTVAAPFVFVQPAFAPTLIPSTPADAILAPTRFGDAIELLGYRLAEPHVLAGGTLQVTTYWRALRPIPRDQHLLIRLLRADGQSGGQAHFVLGTSLYPTTLWLPGQIVVDERAVRADESLQPGDALDLQLGVGDELTPLLPVEGAAAWVTGDVAELGKLEVLAR